MNWAQILQILVMEGVEKVPGGVGLVLRLVVKYGPDVAKFLISKFSAGTSPTPAEFDELIALISKPGESYFPPAKSPTA